MLQRSKGSSLAEVENIQSSFSLYQRILGEEWFALAEQVRRAHSNGLSPFNGLFRITRGSNVVSRFLGCLMRMPREAEAVDTLLTIDVTPDGEAWIRLFGTTRMITRQREGMAGYLLERMGPLEFRFRLDVVDGGINYQQCGVSVGIAKMQIPMPGWLSPHVEGREQADGPGRVRVGIRVAAPLVGNIVSYHGHLNV
jgi:hypothetical protein